MAASDGSIIIDAEINSRGFDRGVDRMQGKIGGLGQAVKKLGGIIATVFAAKALIDFGRQAIEIGSSVAEVQNVVDTAFGDMSGRVEEFARNSIQQFGMSQLAAKKTASTYMAMARGMGLPMETAADMSLSLTGLTADVASFYNISQELADIKLKSVFTGETETLKDLGVVMTQTNLKQFALEQGITKSLDKMTQSELVMLRYKYVMEQLALANGDFAKTSDSWANQTRILQMQWQEFMSIVGQSLITVLTPLVKVLNRIVATLIQVANAVNAVISRIFGGANQQIQQTQANAAGVGAAIEDSTEAQDGLTDATKKTAKAQEKMLAGFDTITKIGKKDTGGGSGAGAGGANGLDGMEIPAFESAAIEASAEETAETWADKFANVFKSAWENEGAATIDAIKGSFQSVKELINSIGRSFAEVFTNGTGQDTFETILRITQNIFSIVGNIADAFREAWDEGGRGTAIIQNLWNAFNDVLHMVENVAGATREWAYNLDFGPLVAAIENLSAAFELLVKLLSEAFAWAWENVLLPFGKWTIEAALPELINLLAAAFRALTAALNRLSPVAEWVWDHILAPIAKWTGAVFIKAIQTITSLLEKLANFLSGTTSFSDFLKSLSVGEALFLAVGVAVGTVTAAIALYAAGVTAATAISTAFGAVMAFITSPIALVTAAIAAVVFISIELYKNWDKISAFLKRTWETLKTTASAVAVKIKDAFVTSWNKTKEKAGEIFGAIKTSISNKCNEIKESVKTAWESVLTNAKDVWGELKSWWNQNVAPKFTLAFWEEKFSSIKDGLRAAINGAIGIIEKAINAIVPKINTIKFDVPDFVPVVGGKSFGFNLKQVTLPRLAQGAVIPPNREFLAVLGDQSSGTNIETPLDTMVDAFRRVMQEYGGGTVAVTVNIDGEQIGRYMERAQRQNARRFGR